MRPETGSNSRVWLHFRCVCEKGTNVYIFCVCLLLTFCFMTPSALMKKSSDLANFQPLRGQYSTYLCVTCPHWLCWLMSGGRGGGSSWLLKSHVCCFLFPDQNASAESGKRRLHSPAKDLASPPQAKRKTFNALGLLPENNTGKRMMVYGLESCWKTHPARLHYWESSLQKYLTKNLISLNVYVWNQISG